MLDNSGLNAFESPFFWLPAAIVPPVYLAFKVLSPIFLVDVEAKI